MIYYLRFLFAAGRPSEALWSPCFSHSHTELSMLARAAIVAPTGSVSLPHLLRDLHHGLPDQRGRIEVLQHMAGHANAKTSGLYDRHDDDVSVGDSRADHDLVSDTPLGALAGTLRPALRTAGMAEGSKHETSSGS
jgi:hypothetical protein